MNKTNDYASFTNRTDKGTGDNKIFVKFSSQIFINSMKHLFNICHMSDIIRIS